jgi:hypothetical protein
MLMFVAKRAAAPKGKGSREGFSPREKPYPEREKKKICEN